MKFKKINGNQLLGGILNILFFDTTEISELLLELALFLLRRDFCQVGLLYARACNALGQENPPGQESGPIKRWAI